jgi:hypothetical protein
LRKDRARSLYREIRHRYIVWSRRLNTNALLWVYYSGLIFYFGAEFTKVYADRYGSRVKGLVAAFERFDAE